MREFLLGASCGRAPPDTIHRNLHKETEYPSPFVLNSCTNGRATVGPAPARTSRSRRETERSSHEEDETVKSLLTVMVTAFVTSYTIWLAVSPCFSAGFSRFPPVKLGFIKAKRFAAPLLPQR